MNKQPKKVLMWVNPEFKKDIKSLAARQGCSVINVTRKIHVDKKLVLEENKDEDVIRL